MGENSKPTIRVESRPYRGELVPFWVYRLRIPEALMGYFSDLSERPDVVICAPLRYWGLSEFIDRIDSRFGHRYKAIHGEFISG